MGKMIPKDKMSKKERRKLDAEKRTSWAFSPAARIVESKKTYNRKRISRAGNENGAGDFLFFGAVMRAAGAQSLQPASSSAKLTSMVRNWAAL